MYGTRSVVEDGAGFINMYATLSPSTISTVWLSAPVLGSLECGALRHEPFDMSSVGWARVRDDSGMSHLIWDQLRSSEMRVHSRTQLPGYLRTFGKSEIHRDVTLFFDFTENPKIGSELTCATEGSGRAAVTAELGAYQNLNNSVHAPHLLDLDRPLHLLGHLHLSLYPNVHVYP